jgi:hypothetical protein
MEKEGETWILLQTYIIDDVLCIHHSRLQQLIIGFNLESCPSIGFQGTYGENHVALLRICVCRRCFVFQLIMGLDPEELHDFSF